MSANPIASDLRAVPDASTPLVPEPQKDHRWWSNDEQREYLASQQRDYLKSKTVTGGATLFFRKIDTEFMSRWDPKSLVAQFNIEPRGAFWNPDCPSLFQDFATATRNHVPEQGAEKHLAGDSTITRIRKVRSLPGPLIALTDVTIAFALVFQQSQQIQTDGRGLVSLEGF